MARPDYTGLYTNYSTYAATVEEHEPSGGLSGDSNSKDCLLSYLPVRVRTQRLKYFANTGSYPDPVRRPPEPGRGLWLMFRNYRRGYDLRVGVAGSTSTHPVLKSGVAGSSSSVRVSDRDSLLSGRMWCKI